MGFGEISSYLSWGLDEFRISAYVRLCFGLGKILSSHQKVRENKEWKSEKIKNKKRGMIKPKSVMKWKYKQCDKIKTKSTKNIYKTVRYNEKCDKQTRKLQ